MVIVIGRLDSGEDLAAWSIQRVDETGFFVGRVDSGWRVDRLVDIGEEGLIPFGDSQDASGGVNVKGVRTLRVKGEGCKE